MSKHDPASKAAGNEWQPTRAFAPADTRSLTDAWQATRLQAPVGLRPAPAPAPDRQPVDTWQSTRAQTALATQLFEDQDHYLAAQRRDIGRHTGANEHEMFVSCDPAQALQQQFEHLRPEFIAVHDLATNSSQKLLAGVAAASGRALQRLVIRRQGYGTALATLEFIELPTTDQCGLRVYSTQVDAEPALHAGLARTLLAFSRLGVLMIGELPEASIAAAFKPLREGIVAGTWPNRHLLLLPLATSASLARHGTELGHASRVTVRTTPMVVRPADAWGYISGTWNRLREQADAQPVPALTPFSLDPRIASRSGAQAMGGMPSGDTRPMVDECDAPPAPPTLPQLVPLSSGRPAESAKPPATTAERQHGLLQRYLRQVSELSGVRACCIFEIASASVLEQSVRDADAPAAAELARQGQTLLAAIAAAGGALGLAGAPPDVAITLAAQHLLLRAVPKQPGLALQAVVDKDGTNLTLLRLQLQRLDAVFDEAPQR
jgi:hypothetical protein